MLVGLPERIEEAAGVVADLAAQLAQRDELAGARGHRGLLAVAVKHGELDQRHLQLVGVEVECLDGTADARNVAVVVGAPDVDDLVEAALELVQVVGDVGCKIGVEAIFALDDTVLLVAEGGRAEPLGAVLHVEVPLLLEQADATRDQPGVVERLLRKPDVEMDTEFLEVVAAVGQLLGQRMVVNIGPVLAEQRLGVGDERIEVQFTLLLGLVVGAVGGRQAGRAGHDIRRGAQVLGAVRQRHLLRHIAHVGALVTVGRKGHRDAVLLEVTQPGRQAEDIHLPAGVIDVILACHVPSGEGEQAGQRSAVGGAAAVADVQRSGRVRRNELDLDLLPAPEGGAPEALPFREDGGNDPGLGPRVEDKIDEPGAGHFGLRHQRRRRQLGDEAPGDLARIHLQRLGQLHGEVGGEIAVGRIARTLEQDRRRCGIRSNAGQRLLQQGGQLGFHVMGHVIVAKMQKADYTPPPLMLRRSWA